jgi:hypothetical protein
MAYDSKLSILSAQESASVERKGELAQLEIQTEVLAYLLRNSGLGDLQVRTLMGQVTVSEPLKRWHTNLTLSLYYADLASLQASELHREQSRYFDMRAEEARDQAFVTGVGVVNVVVPRGQVPNLNLLGEEDQDRLVRARVKFVGAADVEGTPSEEFPLRLPVSGATQVSFASLPWGVAGWRLYVAEDQDVFRALQVQAYGPAEVVTVPAAYSLSELRMNPEGQMPDRYLHISRNLGR